VAGGKADGRAAISLQGAIPVRLPPPALVRLLHDPRNLGQAIPLCRSLRQTGPGRYVADIATQAGPVPIRFEATITLTELQPLRLYRVSVKGGTLLTGVVDVQTEVTLDDRQGTSVLRYHGRLSASGIAGRLILPREALVQERTVQMFTRLAYGIEAAWKAECDGQQAPGIASPRPA
jgi:carbon monoxide dehydrogenase subunit G